MDFFIPLFLYTVRKVVEVADFGVKYIIRCSQLLNPLSPLVLVEVRVANHLSRQTVRIYSLCYSWIINKALEARSIISLIFPWSNLGNIQCRLSRITFNCVYVLIVVEIGTVANLIKIFASRVPPEFRWRYSLEVAQYSGRLVDIFEPLSVGTLILTD